MTVEISCLFQKKEQKEKKKFNQNKIIDKHSSNIIKYMETQKKERNKKKRNLYA